MVAEEEVPDLVVVPVEDGEDADELRPAGAALADGRELTGPRISAPVAHEDGFDLLLVDQPLDFCLEVGGEQLDSDAEFGLYFIAESFNLVELAILDKMYVFDAPKSLVCFAVYFAEGSKQM